MYLSRNEIISEAIYKCYKEMYKMAQPSVDFDQIIEDIKSFNTIQKKGGFIEIIREGVYVKNGEVYNYYSITKLELMSFLSFMRFLSILAMSYLNINLS